MEIVADPALGILSRRPLPENWMDMSVHQAGQHSRPLGVDHLIDIPRCDLAEAGDATVLDQDGGLVQQRVRQIAAEKLADIAYEKSAQMLYSIALSVKECLILTRSRRTEQASR